VGSRLAIPFVRIASGAMSRTIPWETDWAETGVD